MKLLQNLKNRIKFSKFRLYTEYQKTINNFRYSVPANPWRVIQISVDNITLRNEKISIYKGLGQIRDGDWDMKKNCVPLDENWIVQGLRERFLDDFSWEHTAYYQKAETEIKKQGSIWEYQSITDFREIQCEYVDSLFENIKNTGYRPNNQGQHNVPVESGKVTPQHKLEPLVSISRDGEIYLRDGHHRYAIADILDLDRIPVQVIARHKIWQQTRENIYALSDKKRFNQYQNHADLQNIFTHD